MNRITLDAITRQADAMAVDVFEIGLYKPAVDGKANEPEMLPRTWDKATLLKSVGWLKYQNSQGRNIYIRPKGEHALSLVDDLTAAALERMKSEGFQPAIVVETSPGNFQAWLNHGRVLPKAESTAAARALAERFGGDRGAADWRHFGRLAGLTNRKQSMNRMACTRLFGLWSPIRGHTLHETPSWRESQLTSKRAGRGERGSGAPKRLSLVTATKVN